MMVTDLNEMLKEEKIPPNVAQKEKSIGKGIPMVLKTKQRKSYKAYPGLKKY